MKKNVVTMVLAMLSLVSVTFAATYSGGSGTIASPYIINSTADMVTLSQTPADWASQFIVNSNISLSGQTLGPIGTFATPFSGNFNGNAKVISGYTNTAVLSSDWTAGLFGYNTGTITNVTVTGNVAPAEQFPSLGSGWIGGIVAVNDGTVSNSTFGATGTIVAYLSGDAYNNVAVGGIVGENTGTVSNCQFLGSITGNVYNVYVGGIAALNLGSINSSQLGGSANINIGFADVSGVAQPYTMVGGIVGYSAEGLIFECSTSASASVRSAASDSMLGGLAGMNSGAIASSQSNAAVNASGAGSFNVTVGGFCGINQDGQIEQSAARGNVTSGPAGTAGGFVGWNNNALISVSYYKGAVIGGVSNYIGEFAGRNSGAAIQNCFAMGTVALPVNLTNTHFGGLVGLNDAGASILNSYVVDKTAKGGLTGFIGGGVGFRATDTGAITTSIWNQTTSGLTAATGAGVTTGLVGKTTAEMKLQPQYTGWNFASIWMMSEAGSEFEGYPIFTWQSTTLVTQTVNMVAGWTWISFNVLPDDASVASVFANYSGANNDIIVASNGANTTYFNGSWLGTLTTIEAGKMYKIRRTTAGSFNVTGSYVNPSTAITLVSGWNWLGYTLPTASNLTAALTGMTLTDGDIITSQTGANATYWGGQWYGSLTTLEPGKGYMIKLATAQTFSYNALAPASSGSVTVSIQDAPNWVSPAGMANLMVIYPQVSDVATSTTVGLSEGSKISAWFPDGTIAGVVDAVAGGPNLYFFPLVVYSNSGSVNNMTLKLYDAATDSIYNIIETFTFVSNDVQGSLGEPIPFTASVEAMVYTVTFNAGTNGAITSGQAVQQVAKGQSAAAPTITANTGWSFTGWDVQFNNVQGNLTVNAQYTPITFTVTFDAGLNGTIESGMAVQTVNYGQSAVAPTIAANQGWTFNGWNIAFNNVTSNLTVTAQYTQLTFSVTFDPGIRGTISSGTAVQTVVYGGAAVAPSITANQGWIFTGWDTVFSNVTSNLTVTAQYTQMTFNVTFNPGTNGMITSGTAVQTVFYGQSAVAPTIAANQGWTFTGWNIPFNNVTSNLTVTAQYSPITFTVTFTAGTNGTITSGTAVQTVVYGGSAIAPTVTAVAGMVFTGWNTSFTNVTSNRTVTAQYAVQTFTVTFSAGTQGILGGEAVQVVAYGQSAIAPDIMPNSYSKFVGWSPSLANITSNRTITAQYVPITCRAADLSGDGSVGIEDIELFAADWLSDVPVAGDINGNGDVGLGDYAMISECWLYTKPMTQTFTLGTGWNWLSFNFLPTPSALSIVLANYSAIATNNDIIQSSDGKSSTFYDGQWLGTLTTIEAGKAYKMKVAAAASFDVEGDAVDVTTPIQLVSGWNWLGYTPQEARPLGVALASLNLTNNDYITAQDGKNATYWSGVWYGSLTTLEPGKGYQLKVNKAQTFAYDAVAVSAADMPIAVSVQAAPATWVSPVGLNNQMIVYAQVTQGLAFMGTAAGSKLSVWNPDGTIAGVADVFTGPAGQEYQITVFSNEVSVAGMTLKLYDAATDLVYNIQEVLNFQSGDVVATIITPQIYTIPEAWTNPVGLANQMTCYVQIFDGATQIGTSAGSLLSAWNPDGTIAGVTSPLVGGPAGTLFSLTVFSNEVSVPGMTFKLYDANTDTIYPVIATFTFESNEFMGGFGVPVQFQIGSGTGIVTWTDTNPLQTTWNIPLAPNPDGSWSIESGPTASNSYSGLTTLVGPIAANHIRFTVRTSCSVKAALIFYIDGVFVAPYWTGNTPDTVVEIPFDGTTPTEFRWVYSKSGATVMGDDKVWVSNIEFITK